MYTPTMVRRTFAWGMAASLLVASVSAGTVQQDWVFPQYPDFSTTLTEGQVVTFSWNNDLQYNFALYCAPCNTSAVNLWVVGGSEDVYQFQIASSIDITMTFSYPWKVLLPANDLEDEQTWALRFIPTGDAPHGAGDGAEISSPQFKILQASSSTSSSTSATGTQTSASSSSATSTGTGGGGGLSTGAEAGIGVGVALGVLLVLAIIGFLLYRRRRRSTTSEQPAQEVMETRQNQHPYSHGPIPANDLENQKYPGSPNPPSAAPPYIPPILTNDHKTDLDPNQPATVHELNASFDPVELDGSGHRELP